jgi:hypothetical protein
MVSLRKLTNVPIMSWTEECSNSTRTSKIIRFVSHYMPYYHFFVFHCSPPIHIERKHAIKETPPATEKRIGSLY